jgi:YggT family protein
LTALLGVNSGNPLYVLGQLYILVLVLRAVLSWFPSSPRSPLAPVIRVIYRITEPVLIPFRRLIPPIGMFDISFLVAFIVLEVIVDVVLRPLPI